MTPEQLKEYESKVRQYNQLTEELKETANFLVGLNTPLDRIEIIGSTVEIRTIHGSVRRINFNTQDLVDWLVERISHRKASLETERTNL